MFWHRNISESRVGVNVSRQVTSCCNAEGVLAALLCGDSLHVEWSRRPPRGGKMCFPDAGGRSSGNGEQAMHHFCALDLAARLVEILTYCCTTAEHVLHTLCFDYLINKRKCR